MFRAGEILCLENHDFMLRECLFMLFSGVITVIRFSLMKVIIKHI